MEFKTKQEFKDYVNETAKLEKEFKRIKKELDERRPNVDKYMRENNLSTYITPNGTYEITEPYEKMVFSKERFVEKYSEEEYEDCKVSSIVSYLKFNK